MKRLWLLIPFVFGLHAAASDISMQASASTYTGRDAEATITDALVKAGAGEDIKVSINNVREEEILTSVPGMITADANDVLIDKPHNRWQATLLLKENGRNMAPLKLSGHYDELMQIPVLRRMIQSGEVISSGDIDTSREPATRLRKNTLTDINDIIGKSAKHTISPGRPIRLDEISRPSVIAKGAQVTLYYKTSSIEIRTFGEAMDAGAKGDVIRVRNLASKNVVQGTVESGDRVRVSSPDTSSAEVMIR